MGAPGFAGLTNLMTKTVNTGTGFEMSSKEGDEMGNMRLGRKYNNEVSIDYIMNSSYRDSAGIRPYGDN